MIAGLQGVALAKDALARGGLVGVRLSAGNVGAWRGKIKAARLLEAPATGAASDENPAAEFLALVDQGQGSLNGQKWTREELHERR